MIVKDPAVLIDYFDAAPFDFLSNFYPCVVEFEGDTYNTTEAAYQAAKTFNVEHRRRIRMAASPGHAKMLGQTSAFAYHGAVLRKDWETVKYDVMLELLRKKFAQPNLRRMLLSTGNAKLVEGNTWNDRVWGVCDGEGANNLGRSIMLVRAEARVEELVKNAEVPVLVEVANVLSAGMKPHDLLQILAVLRKAVSEGNNRFNLSWSKEGHDEVKPS